MELNNAEWKTAQKIIAHWEQSGELDSAKAERLRASIHARESRHQIAQYFFIIALVCTLMAFAAIFIDEKLLERLRLYFSLRHWVVAILMAALAFSWFYYLHRKMRSVRPFLFEVYVVPGVLASVTSLVYICKEVGFGASNSGFLFATLVLMTALSVFFSSRALWVAGIVALVAWFGSITYVYSHDHAFLGMNYAVRYALLGLIILAASFGQRRVPRLLYARQITYIAGLLVLFMGLWAMSSFGNYHDLEAWSQVRQVHVLAYAFLFGVAAMAALYLGVRYNEPIARDLGVIFLILNFYTRYFEYFWDSMHKGLFFLILAVSFWFLGRWIERRRRQPRG